MSSDAGKQGDKYAINMELTQDLTPEQTEHLNKVVDLATSSIRLFLKNDPVHTHPIKPTHPTP
jgi:hypothetical protein